jgi:hypothetical protein
VLAEEGGVVFETDQYFYSRVGSNPLRYDYDADLLDAARRWNFERYKEAVLQEQSPIVVDRGNSLDIETHAYARFAHDRGYRVELKEPDSPWWQELRVLLKYKPITNPILEQWARQLGKLSRGTHRVPLSTIRHWMERWKWDVTIQDILNYRPRNVEEETLLQQYMQTQAEPLPDATDSRPT